MSTERLDKSKGKTKMKKMIMFLLLQVTFLYANTLDSILIDMRDENYKMVNKTKFEEVHYFTPKKLNIRKKIVYDKFKNIVSRTEYHYSTKKLYREEFFVYDKNINKKTRPIEIVVKQYAENGNKISEKKSIVKNGKVYRVYRKQYSSKDGVLSGVVYYSKKKPQKKVKMIIYNKDRTISLKESFSSANTRKSTTEHYKNNIVVKKENYYNGKKKYRHGDFVKYNDDGSFNSLRHYSNDLLQYTSYCKFDIENYMEVLEVKYETRTKKFLRDATRCKKLDKDRYLLVTDYNRKEYTEHKKNVALWLVIVNEKNKEIEKDFFYLSKHFDYLDYFDINKLTYKSKIVEGVFDVISNQRINRYEYANKYESFLIRKNNIIVLEQPTFSLDSIIKETKSGNKISISVISGLLFEVVIDNDTLKKYNNIAYYLQKANANKEAIYLLRKILEKFPNRTVAHYNLADAYWAMDDKKKAKEHYSIYIKQMKAKGKEKRIPKVVKLRVLGK